jgi:transglutaminase-like putative cysteine protease
MIIEIQHETRLQYTDPVTEWMSELRVEPVSDADQSCQTFHLGINQQTAVHRYQDGFGNRVHHFNLLSPAREVCALSACVVETHPRVRDLSTSKATYPISIADAPLEVLDFLQFRGPVRKSAKLSGILQAIQPADGDRAIDFVLTVANYIRGHFTYARQVTSASSPIDDVLEKGKGVCQDFAHLMIGILRAYGVPARYVSGYIHRPNKDSQSHAWVEAWIPDLGWLGIDPTNNRPTDEHFVKVAIGRDFTDVPPNKGVYRGVGEEQILARVSTRQLDRLPTLHWQEGLPPLDVPLKAVFAILRDIPTMEEEVQQQQQQQQQQ